MNPVGNLSVDWRADYDPARSTIVNSGLDGNARFGNYYGSAGYSRVTCMPVGPLAQTLPCEDAKVTKLSPPANQFRTGFGYGTENKRGWIAGFSSVYDFRTATMQFATTQVTYNTDCCGFSLQYRRFNFGTRNENQFRVALSIANIGSFGTLKKQERLF
jgi:LPS-assembly protein